MDFRLSEEQELLRDSARRYFGAEGGLEQRRRHGATAVQDEWQRYAEFGWLGMAATEDAGGLGASVEDIAILSEEMGRGLAQDSFIGGAILPLQVLQRCEGGELCRLRMTDLIAGTTRVALAAYEPDRRYSLHPDARVTATGADQLALNGSKTLVLGGASADLLIVSATLGAIPVLALVNVNSAGVRRRGYETLDGVAVADFFFEDTVLSRDTLVASGDDTRLIIEDALDQASLYLCAEILGCMDKAIELTASYLKIRKQFGKALAEFQVLQHAVAEMAIDANSARSMVYRAMAAMELSRAQRQRAISACAIHLMQAAKRVTGSAVHLHGGIGVSCEYPVGHYLRRVIVAERILGDREHHLARYMGA